jgi:hypothetical protein
LAIFKTAQHPIFGIDVGILAGWDWARMRLVECAAERYEGLMAARHVEAYISVDTR